MVVDYLDYFVFQMLPEIIPFLDSLIISDGVSLLGLIVAITILSLVVGSILMRVS